MNANQTLREATVQDIQLELIRRTSFNAFDGERVYLSLWNHRELWLAVLLDRPGYANLAEHELLLSSGLIKLRDLPDNIWNADTLIVLTRTREDAKQFARVLPFIMAQSRMRMAQAFQKAMQAIDDPLVAASRAWYEAENLLVQTLVLIAG